MVADSALTGFVRVSERLGKEMAKSRGSFGRGPHIDSKSIRRGIEILNTEQQRVEELGNDLNSDLEEIDAAYSYIENDSTLERSEKINRLKILREDTVAIKERYETDVQEVLESTTQEIQEMLDEAQEGADEARKESAVLKSVKLKETNRGGIDKASEDALENARKFEQLKAESAEDLRNRIERMNRLRRQVMRNRASGR